MLDFVMYVFSFNVLVLFAFIVWESFVMADEKKERQCKGLTYYYDNPIEKNNARTD